MKGDFSRQTFDPRKHYSGVLMQQGRVQTDADWNEQGAIERRRVQIEARDVIGRCGAPRDNAGFAVTVTDTRIGIGAGRYYVDGLLAENETDGLAYDAQPDLPGAVNWAAPLTRAGVSHALVYLDVWERHITPLDDALLREVALGGPDTATRIKTVWQVRVLPLGPASPPADPTDPTDRTALQAKRAKTRRKADAMKAAVAVPRQIAKLQEEITSMDAAIAAPGAPLTCDGVFPEWNDLVADPERRMNARTRPPVSASGPCVVPPTAGYRRLENQLYRVEVHKPGAPGTATFKWSRDDGTVVTAIEKISGKDVTVHNLGPDDVLGFASGQWVEIGDDRSELAGKPGQLARIETVNSSQRRITLDRTPTPLAAGADSIDASLHPKLRRWDQNGSSATSDGVAMTAAWLPLEDGVEVQFENADFRTGDYWWIPARTATGEIEWPPFAVPNASPEPQPRRGIHHHFSRLALLAFNAASRRWSVAEDCRKLFPPLTEPCCEARALHVADTNWSNDDAFALQVLARQGLRIRLDAPPDPSSLTNDTVQVVIELPYTAGQDTAQDRFQRVVWRGDVSRDAADDRVIVWRPRAIVPPADTLSPARRGAKKTGARTRATRGAAAAAGILLEGVAGISALPIGALSVRVTLKGHWIWNDRRDLSATTIYLDGRAFGRPGTRADRSPRIDLVLPSGHNLPASDFESWFFFGGRAVTPPLQVTNVAFLGKDGKPSSAGDVKPPLAPGKSVGFQAAEIITSVQITFNRPILEGSLGPPAQSNIYVEQTRLGRPLRLPAAVTLVTPTQALYALLDTQQFGPSDYVLTCVGGAAGAPAGIVAKDDNSPLDGDYDSQPGGDLKLPFTSSSHSPDTL